MAEAKEVEVQVLADEQDDTENKVSAPKKGNSFSKTVSQLILARRFFDELDDSMKSMAYAKRHDPAFWEGQLKLFDLSQCYELHQSSNEKIWNEAHRQAVTVDYSSPVEQHKLLYEYYDLTHSRISRLFDSFDKDKSGELSLNEFIVGLARHGILPEHKAVETPSNQRDRPVRRIKSDRTQKVAELSQKVLRSSVSAKESVEPNFEGRHFRQLLKAVDSNNDEHVDRVEFVMVLQGLKMSMLLNEEMAELTRKMLIPDDEELRKVKVNISVIDYSPHTVCYSPYPLSIDGLKKVMFGAKDTSLIDMSWISLSPDHSNAKCGIDPVTILRFAVKYRLHPLAIHDAMTLGAQRPKVNEYNGDFFFVILPTFRLTKKSMDAWRAVTKAKTDKILRHDRERTMGRSEDDSDEEEDAEDAEDVLVMSDKDIFGPEPLRVRVEIQQVGLFVKATAPYDVVISLEEGWHAFHVHYEQPNGSATSRIKNQRNRAYRRSGMFNTIVRDLGNDFSFSRQGNSLHLMYTMIQTTMEELESVTGAYRTRLGWFQVMLQIEEWQLERKYIRRLLSTQRELDKLIQISRPCTSVLRHLISIMESDRLNDMNGDHRLEIRTYLEDLLDQFNMMMEDLNSLSGLCKSYYIEYDTYQDQRMNRVLYFLTLITVLFLPLQTATGLYGMNFAEPAPGKEDFNGYGMPELHFYQGYLGFFWPMVTGITLIMLTWMMSQSIIPCNKTKICCRRICPCLCYLFSCCCRFNWCCNGCRRRTRLERVLELRRSEILSGSSNNST